MMCEYRLTSLGVEGKEITLLDRTISVDLLLMMAFYDEARVQKCPHRKVVANASCETGGRKQ